MLRLQTEPGWWLVTHPDHAALAGDFARNWGNDLFAPPEPREQVLRGIYAHDDGWKARDQHPVITRSGLPAAFSRELVGRYSAFEEIVLAAYLAVRANAVNLIAQDDPYAAILISMHTHNLLSERADRSTIAPADLPLLDTFLAGQKTLQQSLFAALPPEHASWPAITANFRLLQACDNLSLLACTDFPSPATLLHPLRTQSGHTAEVAVTRIAERTFRLEPYPFATEPLTLRLRARFVPGQAFASSEALESTFHSAEPRHLGVTLTA